MTQWEDSHAASQHIIREQAKGRLQHLRRYTEVDLHDPPQEPELPPIPDAEPPRLKPGEMELFLKLSAALTVLLARTVYLQDLEVAHTRLLEYLQGYVEVSFLCRFRTLGVLHLANSIRCTVLRLSSQTSTGRLTCMSKYWTMVQCTVSGPFFKNDSTLLSKAFVPTTMVKES